MRSLVRSTLLASLFVSPIFVLRSPQARASEPLALPSPLPLEAVLEAVRERSPALLEARRLAHAASLRPRILGRMEDPSVALEWWQQPLDFHTVPVMISARQRLPWSRTLGLEREVGEREAVLVGDDALVVARRIEADARRAWLDLGLAERSLEVNQRSATLMQHLVEVTRSQYRVGRATWSEVVGSRSELLMIEGERLDLDRDREEAQARLNELLDRPAEAPLGPSAPSPDPSPLPSRGVLLEALIARRPEVLRARHGIEVAEARRSLAEREGRPVLEAWAGYMVHVGGPDTFTLGLSSTLPLSSLRKRDAMVVAESAALAAGRAGLGRALRRGEAEVQAALVRIEAAARHVRLHREQLLPLADAALESVQASYVAGRMTFGAVLEAARAVRTHHMEHLRFVAEHGKRLADLEEAVGVPLAELASATLGGEGRP